MDHEVREPRTFTPPPWEPPGQVPKPDRPKVERADVIEAEPAPAAGKTRGEGDEASAPVAQREAAGESRPDVMLAGLAAEESRPMTVVWAVSLGSAVLMALVGAVVVVVAIAGGARAHGSGLGLGLAGSFVLAATGFGLLGAAGWTLVRALRQRGA